ncbi:unnamed protein product [Laminaria digitata]
MFYFYFVAVLFSRRGACLLGRTSTPARCVCDLIHGAVRNPVRVRSYHFVPKYRYVSTLIRISKPTLLSEYRNPLYVSEHWGILYVIPGRSYCIPGTRGIS